VDTLATPVTSSGPGPWPDRYPDRERASPGMTEAVAVRRRKRIYLTMMGTCALLYMLSWTVVAWFSMTWAIVISLVASVLPPVAVILANSGDDVA
jgi:Protein of unknown function (DUF3099)